MAWERSFEARVLKIRDRELKYQKLNYTIEVCSHETIKIQSANFRVLDSLECDLVNNEDTSQSQGKTDLVDSLGTVPQFW